MYTVSIKAGTFKIVKFIVDNARGSDSYFILFGILGGYSIWLL